MAKVSSGLSLSTNYFMRNYYANNRDVIKTSGRNDYTKIELSFEENKLPQDEGIDLNKNFVNKFIPFEDTGTSENL